MENALELINHGIKCDNCDWINMSIPAEDYVKWVDKPCPVCGVNLFTQADFDAVNAMFQLTNMINGMFPATSNEEKLTGRIETNGTGSINIVLDEVQSKVCEHYSKAGDCTCHNDVDEPGECVYKDGKVHGNPICKYFK